MGTVAEGVRSRNSFWKENSSGKVILCAFELKSVKFELEQQNILKRIKEESVFREHNFEQVKCAHMCFETSSSFRNPRIPAKVATPFHLTPFGSTSTHWRSNDKKGAEESNRQD